MAAFSPSPVRTACLTHSALITGSMPGMAASMSETWAFGSPPKAVEAPENSFDCELTWAWTSSPMTTSQPPVAPAINFDLLEGLGIHLPVKNVAELILAVCVRLYWGELAELAMADNRSPNGGIGGLGIFITALVAFLAVAFLLNGGDRFFGKKTIESDKDLPPVQSSQPPINMSVPKSR